MIKKLGIESFPQRILINPTLKIVDESTISFREGCCSMHGFSAIVPRYKEILVTYQNEKGEKIAWRAKNWTARILQHEIDHLYGKIFLDNMVKASLEFNYWKQVNDRNGDFKLSFQGMTKMAKFNRYFWKGLIPKQGLS